MLAAERRHRILDHLRRDGKVVATDLCASLGVSPDTIRRDLQELADANLLQRVHGGALPRSPGLEAFPQRRRQEPAAKTAIARAAVSLLRRAEVIVLDGGTTTLQIAERLPADLEATVITNCPPIALALATHPRVEVRVIGGRLDKHGLVTLGAETVDALRAIRPDICVLGVCSLHPEAGVSVADAEEASVKRALIEGAADVVAVAVADKLGTVAPYVAAPISELTHLVTDATADDEVAPYESAGITVVRV